jgi:hypothetical protein
MKKLKSLKHPWAPFLTFSVTPSLSTKKGDSMKMITALLTLALLATSCASNEKKDEKNPFDAVTLKEVLQEGKTTQMDVIKVFGGPDITTEDNSKQDVWVYSKHKNESKSNGIGAGAVAFLPGIWSLVGANIDQDKSESSSQTITLTLHFDRSKKLKNYLLTKVRI